MCTVWGFKRPNNSNANYIDKQTKQYTIKESKYKKKIHDIPGQSRSGDRPLTIKGKKPQYDKIDNNESILNADISCSQKLIYTPVTFKNLFNV